MTNQYKTSLKTSEDKKERTRINVDVPPELRNTLKQIAFQHDVTLKDLVSEIILTYFLEKEKGKQNISKKSQKLEISLSQKKYKKRATTGIQIDSLKNQYLIVFNGLLKYPELIKEFEIYLERFIDLKINQFSGDGKINQKI